MLRVPLERMRFEGEFQCIGLPGNDVSIPGETWNSIVFFEGIVTDQFPFTDLLFDIVDQDLLIGGTDRQERGFAMPCETGYVMNLFIGVVVRIIVVALHLE